MGNIWPCVWQTALILRELNILRHSGNCPETNVYKRLLLMYALKAPFNVGKPLSGRQLRVWRAPSSVRAF